MGIGMKDIIFAHAAKMATARRMADIAQTIGFSMYCAPPQAGTKPAMKDVAHDDEQVANKFLMKVLHCFSRGV